MDINKRFKTLRTALKLSQTEFGQNLGVSLSVIQNIEYENTVPKELLIQQVCKTYRVRREWLDTGEGDMFEEKTRDEQIAQTIGKWITNDDEFKLKVIGYMTEMTEEEWELLYRMVEKLIKK